jgi:hypothetical protein
MSGLLVNYPSIKGKNLLRQHAKYPFSGTPFDNALGYLFLVFFTLCKEKRQAVCDLALSI